MKFVTAFPRWFRPAAVATMMFALSTASSSVVAQESGSPNLPDVSGMWAQKVVTTAISDVPIVGEVTTQTISLQKVDIAQNGAKLELTTQVCSIDVNSSIDVIETHIPDRFVAAMGVGKRPAKLVERDGKIYLMAPRRTETLGVQLRDPKNEYLPTKKDDPRVIDQDKDGHPGVTVRVSGLIDGSLYIVHRGWDKLLGKIDPKGRIRGGVEWDLEQVVLDSTSVFLGDPPNSRAHKDASKNFFRMKRLPDGADCNAILKIQTGL
jgi:hypothetical protein